MPPTPAVPAGLPGLIHKLNTGLRSGIKGLYDVFIGSLTSMFVFFVVGAAILAIIEHTLIKSPEGIGFWKLLALGLGAILAELLGLKNAIIAWHSARAGAMLGWVGIWLFGFLFSFYNAIGSASEHQAKRESLQKAAFHATGDTRAEQDRALKALKAEEANVKTLKERIWAPNPEVDGKPVATPEAAEALIKGMEANTRFWVQLTEGCTKTAGTQTRKFCNDYAAAKAAKVDLESRGRDREALTKAEAQLTAAQAAYTNARKAVGTTKVATAEHTPFVHTISYLTGMDAEKVAIFEPAQTSLTNMMLVSLAGFIIGLGMVQGKPRTKWFRTGNLTAWLTGREPAAPTNIMTIERQEVHHTDESLKRWLDELQKRGLGTAQAAT